MVSPTLLSASDATSHISPGFPKGLGETRKGSRMDPLLHPVNVIGWLYSCMDHFYFVENHRLNIISGSWLQP